MDRKLTFGIDMSTPGFGTKADNLKREVNYICKMYESYCSTPGSHVCWTSDCLKDSERVCLVYSFLGEVSSCRMLTKSTMEKAFRKELMKIIDFVYSEPGFNEEEDCEDGIREISIFDSGDNSSTIMRFHKGDTIADELAFVFCEDEKEVA